MNKMVTTEYIESEFKKIVTEKFLTSKIERLKIELKDHFDQELEKVYSKIETLERESTQAKQEVE